MKLPAFTQFIDGTGPVFAGSMFPFLFITIACGAISGFHALVSSGTTPKLVNNERDIRMIGYGGMLMESFVAIMALICAAVLDPGVYFAINSPAALLGTSVDTAAEAVRNFRFCCYSRNINFTGSRKWVKVPFFHVLAVRQLLLLVWLTSLRKFSIAVK